MKIKFLRDATVITEKGRETLFSEDDVQNLEQHSAERWIRRGVAIEVVPAKKATDKKPAKKATDKKSGSATKPS